MMRTFIPLLRATKGLWVSIWVLILPFSGMAQDDSELKPVSNAYAITNITIVTSPGKKIEKGTIVMRDGLITAAGQNVAVPADAIIIKADSMYAYAGFIDGYSHTGVTAPKQEKEEKIKYPGNPPPDRAGITPDQDVRNFLNPSSGSVRDLRNLGFTVAQVVPEGNLLPGQAAIVMLHGSTADEMTVVSNSALYSELTGANRIYPATIMGVMAKWRELYKQAQLDKNYEALYASNPTGLARPDNSRIHQAFYPVIDRREPVLFKSEKVLETQRVLTLKDDLGFNVQLADVKEGWLITDKIKNSGAKVFLSLDLPDEMKEDKKGDDKSSEEKKALEARKRESITNYTAQAATFAKTGIAFGFSANSAKPKDIPANLRRMIAAGLSEDAALASLTTTPAQLLGLSGRMGTIEQGKMANLVISDKPYFNEKAKVKYVFVYGNLYTVEETKKSAPGKDVKPGGSWSYSADTPQGQVSGKLAINDAGGSYSGTATNNFSNETSEMKDIMLEGSSLSFNYQINVEGNQIKIDVSVSIEGDSFEGSMTAGEFGTFPMTGTREPN